MTDYERLKREFNLSLLGKGEKGDKGDKGEPGRSGVYVGSGEMPADCNLQIDPSGDVAVIPTEEWIDIADVTITEEGEQLLCATDAEGNPFSCRRICIWGEFPQNLTSDMGMGYSLGEVKYNPVGLYAGNGQFLLEAEVVAGRFMAASFYSTFLGSGFFGQSNTAVKLLHARPGQGVYIDRVDVWPADGYTFPIGLRIRVWGVKAWRS